MSDLIQLRRGNAASWAAQNPILADGEMGLERDTRLFKVGNGILAWNDLPYYLTGPKGDPGSESNSVKDETPIGLINGSNATFTSLFPFIPESVEVFNCGIKIQPTIDFTTSGNQTIHLTVSPLTGENILINYNIQL